jgi:hypothetical protein
LSGYPTESATPQLKGFSVASNRSVSWSTESLKLVGHVQSSVNAVMPPRRQSGGFLHKELAKADGNYPAKVRIAANSTIYANMTSIKRKPMSTATLQHG